MTGEEQLVEKIRGYTALLRPFTLAAPVVISMCVITTSLIYTGRTDISFLGIISMVLTASLCFALLNGASNALNQATDFREDKISKPYRPIPLGIITPREAKTIACLLYASAFLLSLLVHIMFCLFISLIMFFSISYSLPPRMKKHLLLNQLWVAVSRGFLGILGSWSVFGDPFQKLPLAIGCISAIFLFGGTTTKDLLDAESDKKTGTKTLVNVYGVKKSAQISLVFMVTAFILIIPLTMLHLIDAYLYPLAFLLVLGFLISWCMTHNHKNEKYENTRAWTLMYATYMIYIAVFSLIIYLVNGTY
jgi:4-hydroxybenzoate polyprenyltransferase